MKHKQKQPRQAAINGPPGYLSFPSSKNQIETQRSGFDLERKSPLTLCAFPLAGMRTRERHFDEFANCFSPRHSFPLETTFARTISLTEKHKI